MLKVKIILAGDSGVGKTRIFRSLFSMPLTEITHYVPTDAEFMSPLILGDDLELDIWDIPGLMNLEVPSTNFKNLGGAVVVFDVTRTFTFENTNRWLARIWQDSPGIPVILVANKADLIPHSYGSQQLIKQAEQFANRINSDTQYFCRFLSISAVESKYVYRIFSELFVAIQMTHKQHPELY
ncbi:MAG: GTP-binding protein, partial [Candidatus Hodarchaeales archaeon]